MVLISDSGTSRQLELTSFRLRLLGVAAVILICLVGVGVTWSVAVALKGAPQDSVASALQERVTVLEEQLHEKDMQLAALKNGIESKPEPPPAPPVTSLEPPEPPVAPETFPSSAAGGQDDDGPLTSIAATSPEAPESEWAGESSSGARSSDPEPEVSEPAVPKPVPAPEPPQRVAATPPTPPEPPEPEPREPPTFKFSARNLVADPENAKDAHIAFRLRKDHNDFMFQGRLFVIVEMTDEYGRNNIYPFPVDTVLGDAYLPKDPQHGKKIRFKRYTTVEVPYGDPLRKTSLAAVSVLLYGKDGNIVYQRTFNRNQVKMRKPRRAL